MRLCSIGNFLPVYSCANCPVGSIKEHYEVIITFVEPVKKIDASTLPFKHGCMKDKMWMADDFNAPLDDFKEYM